MSEQLTAAEPIEAITTVTESIEAVATNPYNPTHSAICRCPSCCKKAKIARGEPIKERKDKGIRKSAAPAPATPAIPAAPAKEKMPIHERAVAAANARYEQRFDWQTAPLDKAMSHLAELRMETEKGARIIQQRTDTARLATVPCEVCKKPVENGKWAMQRTFRDPATGLARPIFLCGQLCIAKYNHNSANYAPATGTPTGLPKQ